MCSIHVARVRTAHVNRAQSTTSITRVVPMCNYRFGNAVSISLRSRVGFRRTLIIAHVYRPNRFVSYGFPRRTPCVVGTPNTGGGFWRGLCWLSRARVSCYFLPTFVTKTWAIFSTTVVGIDFMTCTTTFEIRSKSC